MIRIIKGSAPASLVQRGNAQTVIDHKEYIDNRADYDSGEKKFKAKTSIYNSDIVRGELVDIQKNKCCYCETKDVRSNTDVEHYRPKTAYSESLIGSSMYPGYFWLAYDWDNLFLACQVCNQIFKNDFFPIEDNATRAQRNRLSINNEIPILIHPSIDNPEEHIGYRESIPYGISSRGSWTIDYLGFGRLDTRKDYTAKQKARIKLLVEERETYYNDMKLLNDVISIFSNKPILNIQEKDVLDKARAKLNNARLSSAKWSSMIKCAVRDNFEQY